MCVWKWDMRWTNHDRPALGTFASPISTQMNSPAEEDDLALGPHSEALFPTSKPDELWLQEFFFCHRSLQFQLSTHLLEECYINNISKQETLSFCLIKNPSLESFDHYFWAIHLLKLGCPRICLHCILENAAIEEFMLPNQCTYILDRIFVF